MAGLGHEVHLLCQERNVQGLPWIDAVGTWDEGELHVEVLREPVRCTVYTPPIGRVLPVYVADSYEGFDAKPFEDLTDAELERYIETNVNAVRAVASRAAPDAALANHLVMGPVVLARAGLGYAVKIHGSALEYTVKRHPDRFMPLAPSPSELPWAVEHLRMCGCSLEQLAPKDVNDCPHCGRRLPAIER